MILQNRNLRHKIEVIKDLLEYVESTNNLRYDYIIDLDITSPLRTTLDIEKALKLLISDKKALNIFSVSKASRNPYFNMVEKDSNSKYVKLIRNEGKFSNRQDAPEVFDMNASFYIYKRFFFDSNNSSAITGKSLHYLMPDICFDLDEPIDFEIMECLLKEGIIKIQEN